jgi:hypothetical protein
MGGGGPYTIGGGIGNSVNAINAYNHQSMYINYKTPFSVNTTYQGIHMNPQMVELVTVVVVDSNSIEVVEALQTVEQILETYNCLYH